VKCWGNDLVPASNWDGLYKPSLRNHLTSPVVNCTGKTGVTLSYRRWLSVEDGTYDQARIRVSIAGGPWSTVWQNAATSGGLAHHVDAAWAHHVIRLPSADNQANVRLRFELETDAGLELGGWTLDDLELDAYPSSTTQVTTMGGTTPGTLAFIRLTGGPGEAFALAADVAVSPLFYPGIGTLSLNATSPSFLVIYPPGAAAIPPSGQLDTFFWVPSGLTGLTVWLQAVFLPLAPDEAPVTSNVHALTFN
ncbi:MAG TPA: hypothetical protein VEI02_03115, partial [Planctomycetota bacterium]|nr:hypothetical protein [Planctomycetota bacterium]